MNLNTLLVKDKINRYNEDMLIDTILAYFYVKVMVEGHFMKRKIIIIFGLILLLIPFLIKLDVAIRYNVSLRDFYKYSKEITAVERQIIERRPLIVGLYDDVPLSFTNAFNNYNSGIVVDYISQIGIETRSNIIMKVRQRDSILENLEREEVDVIVMESTAESNEMFDLTIPLCVVKTKILVPVNSDINHYNDIRGKSLVVLKTDNIDGRISGFIDTIEGARLIEVDNIYQCFALLRNDEVDGFIGDDMEASHFLNVTNKSSSYRFLDSVIFEKPMSLAVSKGNRDIVAILNKGILSLKKKNLIAQTQYKWLGEFDSDSRDLRSIELMYNVALGIVVIVVFFSSWNYIITQRVNTKTRELRESKEELRLIIDTMKNGIMVIEDGCKIIECNDALETITKIPRDILIGQSYKEINALAELVVEDNMNRLTRVDSHYYYMTCQVFGSNRKMIVIEDYTDKYYVERNRRLESKMVAVGQLSAGLAHEIRNPLGLIKSYSYIIRKNIVGELGEHALSVINTSVDRINNLIENLLRFSRLSNNEQKLINMKKAIHEIVESKTEVLEKNKINIGVKIINQDVERIKVNEDMLGIVVNNLIDNAIDAFQQVVQIQKKIDIDIELRDTLLILKISDNGCGIERGKLENIFDPFYSTKENGTGLGLYILKTEIKNNHGRISVDSIIDVGTQFVVELPVGR